MSLSILQRVLTSLLLLVLAAPAAAQDAKAAAVQARSKQPAVLLNHQQAAAVLRDTVVLLGGEWGFLRKDGGNNCDVGAAYRVSCDWVVNRVTNQGCDLFGDAPGYDQAGAPVRGTMQPSGCGLEPSPGQWVPPAGAPAPPPPPPATDPRIELLEAKLAALAAELEGLKARPLPLDVLLEGLTKVYFECRVGRSAFHGHACEIREPRAK
jgi:hypothetical protein